MLIVNLFYIWKFFIVSKMYIFNKAPTTFNIQKQLIRSFCHATFWVMIFFNFIRKHNLGQDIGFLSKNSLKSLQGIKN